MLDAGVEALLKTVLPDSPSGRGVTLTIRLIILIGGFFPFLLATLQIHPQRIATKETPAEWDLPYEEVIISSRGRQLKGW
ncbi:MAG: hypothetical protein ACI8T1_000327 [Verrucomicrobiales bacterium]